MPTLPQDLAPRLLAWYSSHRRDLPWREDRDPYRVWVSEIMLQQTRVETVKSYFTRFVEALPDVRALAEADEEQLMTLWAGLGYYRRARLLQKCAQTITADHHGVFPRTAAELGKLPGIGRYTAGAVASIAFDQPAPAVDGNVLRVLARFLASSVDANAAEELLRPCYFPGKCGDFTQSLMELGATVCLPNGAPRCEDCPLAEDCRARSLGDPGAYPAPAAKVKRRVEQLTVLILRHGGRIALRRRPDTGVLAGLWELPNIPGEDPGWGKKFGRITSTRRCRHIFTHIEWHMLVLTVDCAEENSDFTWSAPGERPLPNAFAKLLS